MLMGRSWGILSKNTHCGPVSRNFRDKLILVENFFEDVWFKSVFASSNLSYVIFGLWNPIDDSFWTGIDPQNLESLSNLEKRHYIAKIKFFKETIIGPVLIFHVCFKLITSIQKTLTWQWFKRIGLCLFATSNSHPCLEGGSLALRASGCRLPPASAAFHNQIADDAEFAIQPDRGWVGVAMRGVDRVASVVRGGGQTKCVISIWPGLNRLFWRKYSRRSFISPFTGLKGHKFLGSRHFCSRPLGIMGVLFII